MLDPDGLEDLLATFDLGGGTLSPGPAATGRQGEICRPESTARAWAAKTRAPLPIEPHFATAAPFPPAAAAPPAPTPSGHPTPPGPVQDPLPRTCCAAARRGRCIISPTTCT